MDLLKIIEEELRRSLEGSDADLVLALIEAYRSSGPKAAKEKMKEALSQWGVYVEDIED